MKFERRTFLRKGVLGLAGFCAAAHFPRAWAQQMDYYGGFDMGVQSFCFRKFTVNQAFEHTHTLGLRYIEVFPGHMPSNLPDEKLAEIKAKAQSLGITINAYGVVGFGRNKEKDRLLFEFARKAGIEYLSANPSHGSFDDLEELVREFDIKIAIHNHGPKSLYSTDDDVIKAIEGRDKRIGACVDTGHFIRSGVDPVKAVKRIGSRVLGVHLKDIRNGKGDVVLGRGGLVLPAFLKALKEIDFQGFLSLEYEADPENPVPSMRECLKAVQKALEGLPT